MEDQVRQAVTGPPAFGMPSPESVEKKLREFKGYRDLFKKAFPTDKEPVTVDNFRPPDIAVVFYATFSSLTRYSRTNSVPGYFVSHSFNSRQR